VLATKRILGVSINGSDDQVSVLILEWIGDNGFRYRRALESIAVWLFHGMRCKVCEWRLEMDVIVYRSRQDTASIREVHRMPAVS
jgi:hypothetical protein